MNDETLPLYFFFVNDPATTEIYTLSLHDALPICDMAKGSGRSVDGINLVDILGACCEHLTSWGGHPMAVGVALPKVHRSEEHTSELQSQSNLVCRLLLEKKKKINVVRKC